MRDPLTVVTEQYRKNRQNHRLLFGMPTRSIRLDWHRKMQVFKPGHVFGYERWSGNRHGTQAWSIVVCRTASGGRSLTRLPGILPGVDVYLHAKGRVQCERVFAMLDGLQSDDIDPSAVSARHWRAVQMAISMGTETPQFVEGLSC